MLRIRKCINKQYKHAKQEKDATRYWYIMSGVETVFYLVVLCLEWRELLRHIHGVTSYTDGVSTVIMLEVAYPMNLILFPVLYFAALMMIF